MEEEAARQERLADRSDILVERGRGVKKVWEWINNRNEGVCVNAVGMTSRTFRLLCSRLRELNLVSDHRGTTIELHVGMALYMLRKGATYRTLIDEFQVSMRTVSM